MKKTILILLLTITTTHAYSQVWLTNWYNYINSTIINGPPNGGTKLIVGNIMDTLAKFTARYSSSIDSNRFVKYTDSTIKYVTPRQLRDTVTTRVKYIDSNTIYVTPKQLKDTASTRVKYLDSNTVYVTPKQLRDSVSGRVKYTDSTTIFVTSKQLRDTAATRVKYTDSTTIFVTPKQLRDTVATRVKYTDSTTIYVTPKQLRDTASGRVKYTDSTAIFVTPKQLRDTAATRVKYSDSLTIYATPKNLRDTANSLRTAINGKQNTLSGTGIVKSTAGTISYLPDPLEVSHGGTNSTAFVAGSIPYMNATGTQFLDGIGVIYRDVYTSGLQGIAIFTPAGASAVDAGLTVGTNGGAGLYCLSFPSTLGSSVPHVYGPADQPLNVNSAIPLSATTAQAGNNLNLNGADAKAGSSVAGAAKGADIVLNPGDAKRLTSGGAQGGGIIINGGDGIGGGTGGWIAANVSGTGSTGIDLAVYISHTVNGTSTEASTSLLIDRTNTAVGTGNQMYLELQASTVPRTGISSTGAYLFGRQSSGVYNLGLYASTDAGLTQSTGTTRSLFLGAQANTSLTNHIVTIGMMSGTSMQSTASGISGILRLMGDVVVSSGTTEYSMVYYDGTINQSSTGNGALYGVYMKPTLTAVGAGRWHSFATAVNSPARAFWATGTAQSALVGRTTIGTTTDNGTDALQVAGSINSATPNTGVVTDASTMFNISSGQFRYMSRSPSFTGTGNTTFTVPANTVLDGLAIRCASAQSISAGTTAGATDIMNAVGFTTSFDYQALNRWFSTSASQTVFITGGAVSCVIIAKLK